MEQSKEVEFDDWENDELIPACVENRKFCGVSAFMDSETIVVTIADRGLTWWLETGELIACSAVFGSAQEDDDDKERGPAVNAEGVLFEKLMDQVIPITLRGIEKCVVSLCVDEEKVTVSVGAREISWDRKTGEFMGSGCDV